MANTTEFDKKLEELLKGVPFVSDAKRDACYGNIKFFYFKAVNKNAATPKDKDDNLRGFVNQVETLVNKLVNDKVILKNWGDFIKDGIVAMLNGEPVPSEPKPEEAKVEPKPQQTTKDTPKVEPGKMSGEKPKVQPKKTEIDMSNIEHVDLSKVEEIKPRPGESQEEFQGKMNEFVNNLFSDPSKFSKKEEPNEDKGIREDKLSGNSTETKTDKSEVENTNPNNSEPTGTENASEQPEEVNSAAEEVPDDQGTFCGTSSQPEPDEDKTSSSSESDDSEDDEPIIDHLDKESEDETVQEDDESDEEESQKTEESKTKKVLKTAAKVAIPIAIGVTIGFVAGKEYGSRKSSNRGTGVAAFKRK